MILCLDAGNTRLKYGLHDRSRWLLQGAVSYNEANQLAQQLPQRPTRILASNVAGEKATKLVDNLATKWTRNVQWLESTVTACGVTNGYDVPEQLGVDRWAALIGARALHDGPLVVVMAGTATTIDTLDASGRFRGGPILPGVKMMCRALCQNTAGLPEANGAYRAIPTNTDDAIASGALHATLGAITRMRQELGNEAVCILSGGNAAQLESHIDRPCRSVEFLVLEGVLRLGTSNRQDNR